MNQLLYCITGGIAHQIRREKPDNKVRQKWLFAVSEILISKIGIGFVSIFLLKARVLYWTILKRKNLSIPLKVETDQFVICLALPECFSVKICCILPSNTAKRIVTALMPSLLFRCFSLFPPHLSTLTDEKRSENCFRIAKYNIFPRADNGCSSEKKNFWRSDLLTPSAECTIGIFEHAYAHWSWLRGSASYVINRYTKFQLLWIPRLPLGLVA